MTPKTLRDEILRLPAADRLQLLEDIWDSLTVTPEEVPVPDWHKAELDRRLGLRGRRGGFFMVPSAASRARYRIRGGARLHVVRAGPEGHDRALRRGHARAMDFTGKPMRGLLYVM